MNKFLEQTKKAANAARQASISNLNAASTALSNASGTQIKLTTMKTDEELKRILLETPILFSGSAWKRRGGLGKLASYTSAWESRHLQLRGAVLLYFDSDPTKALSSSNDPQELLRGYIDLAEEKATIMATFGHSGGAPSPFCLSIKVPTIGTAQETKWKLCFDHHCTQMEWLTVISDVIIQSSVDMYNRALLDAANPSNHGGSSNMSMMLDSPTNSFLRRPPVFEPGRRELHSNGGGTNGTSAKPRSNSFQIVDCPHQLWMMDEYTIERKTTQTQEQKDKTRASVDTALQVMERLLAEERNQRTMASKKATALGLELETVQTSLKEREEQVAKLTTEKRALETELAIRISTHDMGDSGRDDSQAIRDNVALRTKVEELTRELELVKKEWQQNQESQEDDKLQLEQQLAELQTKLVITQNDKDELTQKVNKVMKEQEQAQQVETVKSTLEQRIAQLEQELESNKKEYQESIQALALSFQQSVGGAAGIGGSSFQSPPKQQESTIIPQIERTKSDVSDSEDFEDCVES